MTLSLAHLTDLVAITALVILFLRRHGRRELVVAYLVVNVGVLLVASVLATSAVAVGLGLGLFGVLSIIRLRSEELSQSEVAYYFAALALGLLGGLAPTGDWVVPALMLGPLLALWIGGHPRLTLEVRRQELVLDRALTDEAELIATLRDLLGVNPSAVEVRRTDLVNDTTTVLVRYPASASAAIRTERRDSVAAGGVR